MVILIFNIGNTNFCISLNKMMITVVTICGGHFDIKQSNDHALEFSKQKYLREVPYFNFKRWLTFVP